MHHVNRFNKALAITTVGFFLATTAVFADATLKDIELQNEINAAQLQYQSESSGAMATHAPMATQEGAEEPAYLLTDVFKKMDIKVSGTATLDYFSNYIWRGQVLDRDGVVQPGFMMMFNDLTVGYWGSWDVVNGDTLNSDESDYFVALNHTFMNLITAGVGHTWYSFPGTLTSSKEIYATLGVLTYLNPVFTYAHDYEDGKDLNSVGHGDYYSLALSYSLPLKDKYGSSLEFATTGGYVDGQWLSGKGWHVTPSLGLKLYLAQNITVTPTFGYNFPMKDLKDPAIGNQVNKFFSAVKTAYTF